MGGLGLMFRRRAIQAHPTAGSDYIKFADAEVLRVLIANGVSSDGVGVTKDDALKLTSLGSIFKDNGTIVSFSELDYFLNVKQLTDYVFSYCVNLKSIGCSNIEVVKERCFDNSGVEELILENIVEVGARGFFGMKKIKKIVLGERLSIIRTSNFWSWSETAKSVIIKAKEPPTIEGDNQPGWYAVSFYVPDESVDAYKAANRWSSWASRIYPISQYVE